jgi:hypothetical protein
MRNVRAAPPAPRSSSTMSVSASTTCSTSEAFARCGCAKAPDARQSSRMRRVSLLRNTNRCIWLASIAVGKSGAISQ